jgi:post-segregation antitoxin (ccd killing protein)
MAIDSVSSAAAVPLQVTAALEAIAEAEAAELQVATELEQGIQAAAAPLNPNLGQVINLSV